jgi:hypothetical protein
LFVFVLQLSVFRLYTVPMHEARAHRLDVISTLRLAVRLWWEEFAPITLLGFVLVTMPSVLAHVVLGGAQTHGQAVDTTLSTFVQTLTALLMMLFACAVSYGIMSAMSGRRLRPADFIRAGLWAARPGLVVSLVLGAGTMGLSIVLLLLGRSGGGLLLSAAVLAVAFWALALFFPAVPAAIAERKLPLEALRRSLELTRGARLKLIGLLLLVGLALLPAAGIVRVVIFGTNASAQEIQAAVAQMTLTSPGLWIAELFNLLLLGLLAVLPAVVYAELSGLGSNAGKA